MSLRFNLERKVRMDSPCRRCLGHCLIVNLPQHANAIKDSQQTDSQKKSLGGLKVFYIRCFLVTLKTAFTNIAFIMGLYEYILSF